ncbi:MAG: hypothetical protein P4L46_06170 [Fimbriimonas sp.]|nr:hypothetical protein [Fimbriimonas sp.]
MFHSPLLDGFPADAIVSMKSEPEAVLYTSDANRRRQLNGCAPTELGKAMFELRQGGKDRGQIFQHYRAVNRPTVRINFSFTRCCWTERTLSAADEPEGETKFAGLPTSMRQAIEREMVSLQHVTASSRDGMQAAPPPDALVL